MRKSFTRIGSAPSLYNCIIMKTMKIVKIVKLMKVVKIIKIMKILKIEANEQ